MVNERYQLAISFTAKSKLSTVRCFDIEHKITVYHPGFFVGHRYVNNTKKVVQTQNRRTGITYRYNDRAIPVYRSKRDA